MIAINIFMTVSIPPPFPGGTGSEEEILPVSNIPGIGNHLCTDLPEDRHFSRLSSAVLRQSLWE
jgi:hypothetical protein